MIDSISVIKRECFNATFNNMIFQLIACTLSWRSFFWWRSQENPEKNRDIVLYDTMYRSYIYVDLLRLRVINFIT